MLAMVHGQAPQAAVLSWADSRVPVELQCTSGMGDLFVVRNSGTLGTSAAIASLEDTEGHLHVRLFVGLGPETSGAVPAALHPQLPLPPSLAPVVGQLPMERLPFGGQLSLEESRPPHAFIAAGTRAHSRVLLSDRLPGDPGLQA